MSRFAAVLSLTLALGACMDEPIGPQQGTGDAQLAVLNALALGDQAQLRLDGVVMHMPPSGTTTSAAIPSGFHRLEVRSFTGDLLASADFAAPAGGRRSAVLSGATARNVSLLVVSDTASLPPAGAAKVRLVHTVPKAPIFDTYLFRAGQSADSGARFVSPFMFGVGVNPQFPGYAVRSPGNYTVQLTLPGTGQVMVQKGPITLGAGQVISVVLAENAAAELELRVVRER